MPRCEPRLGDLAAQIEAAAIENRADRLPDLVARIEQASGEATVAPRVAIDRTLAGHWAAD